MFQMLSKIVNQPFGTKAQNVGIAEGGAWWWLEMFKTLSQILKQHFGTKGQNVGIAEGVA
jgi:hypothetical protein